MSTEVIPDYEVEKVYGLVMGEVIRTRGFLGRTIAGVEGVIGGRGRAYAEEMEKAVKEAVRDLEKNARKVGANAVIGVRFEISEVLEGFIVLLAYGTAVSLKKKGEVRV